MGSLPGSKHGPNDVTYSVFKCPIAIAGGWVVHVGQILPADTCKSSCWVQVAARKFSKGLMDANQGDWDWNG